MSYSTCRALCESDPEVAQFFHDKVLPECTDSGQPCGCSGLDTMPTVTCVCDGSIVGAPTGIAPGTSCMVYVRLTQLDRVQPVGMTPVKKVTGSATAWEPACDGGAEAVRLDFNLQSTIEGDNDLQLRPGQDRVGTVGNSIVRIGGDGLTTANFDLDLECLQAHHGDVTGPECTGARDPQSPLVENGLGFIDHTQGKPRGTPVGVAILIDQSSSMLGIVEKDTCFEGREGTFDQVDLIEQCQSDHAGLRLTAAKSIVVTLNKEDPAIVFQFSEEAGCSVVCDPTSLGYPKDTPEAIKRQLCYSVDRNLVIPIRPSGPIDLLQPSANGRSNLWSCVDAVHRFLQEKPEVTRHLVVLTDGPDTCTADSEDVKYCFSEDEELTTQSPCTGATSFQDVRKTFEAYGKGDLHVSFIQFQSKGYPQRDALMTKAACLTGGHHVFLNFNSISEKQSGERRDAILEAVTRIRTTIGGHWTLIADFPGLPVGQATAIAGTLQMIAPTIKETIPAGHFGWGGVTALTPPALPFTDSRLSVINACTSDASCGSALCGLRCSTVSGLCHAPAHDAVCEAGICCECECSSDLTLCTVTTEDTNGDPTSNP